MKIRQPEDLTGMRFSRLTVLRISHHDNFGYQCYLCLCECGNEKVIGRGPLIAGKTKSCGCFRRDFARDKHQLSNLVGRQFGRLRVTSFHQRSPRHGRAIWTCICNCGKEITAIQDSLIAGKKKSCGCLAKEQARENGKAVSTHGHTPHKSGRVAPSPTYISWSAMKERCRNPNNIGFSRYGGRGITVCERWLGPNGFLNFLEDMGERPKGKTIDRKENDKGYSPENCRWATPKEQSANRSFPMVSLEEALAR